ncbi:MAG: transcriptional repressor LexA [Christensenellales bacterium]
MRNLENNLKALMDYIVTFNAENGYLPSVREMANHVGIKSTSTINYYINILEQRNLIKRNTQNKARAFEILNSQKPLSQTIQSNYCLTNIPLVGTITAGKPILAVENIDSQFELSADLFGTGDLFMLKVSGESMINAGIFDGDLIVVHKQQTAENGEIVAALIDDSATVKRFYKEENRIRLQPENPTMSPIYADNVTILGKVVGLIRKMR